jgi:hypothetical protein
MAFPKLDRFHGIRLGIDLEDVEPGRTAVIESERRLEREPSFGYVRVFWWLWLEDGRSVVSVLPGGAEGVRRLVGEIRVPDDLASPALAEALKVPVDGVLDRSGLPAVDRVWADVCFACSGAQLRHHRHGDCRRLTDESIPATDGLSLPTQCFPDGTAYGVVVDGHVVSVAYAHRAGVMEDEVGALGVETAVLHRRRGYAQTAVSHVVQHIACAGGEAVYNCRPGNLASVATARSVGFVPYGRSLILGAPGSSSR